MLQKIAKLPDLVFDAVTEGALRLYGKIESLGKTCTNHRGKASILSIPVGRVVRAFGYIGAKSCPMLSNSNGFSTLNLLGNIIGGIVGGFYAGAQITAAMGGLTGASYLAGAGILSTAVCGGVAIAPVILLAGIPLTSLAMATVAAGATALLTPFALVQGAFYSGAALLGKNQPATAAQAPTNTPPNPLFFDITFSGAPHEATAAHAERALEGVMNTLPPDEKAKFQEKLGKKFGAVAQAPANDNQTFEEQMASTSAIKTDGTFKLQAPKKTQPAKQ